MDKIVNKRFLAVIGGFALMVAVPMVSAQARGIPQVININTQANMASIKGLPKDRKHVNSFSHAQHAKAYLKGKEKYSTYPYTDAFTCSACHPGAKSAEALLAADPAATLSAALDKVGGPRKLMKYFHNICRQCHKKLKKAGIAGGPTNCNGCHGRK